MPGAYERNLVTKIQDMGNRIYAVQMMTTPFMALVKRGPRAIQMLGEWPAKAYGRRGRTGTLDMADHTSYSHQPRLKVGSYGMLLRSDGWQVGTIAAATKSAAIDRREVAEQKADDALLFGQQMERQVLSDADTVQEEGETPYQSRGIFSWLQNAAQTTQPVPAALRPPTTSIYSSTLNGYLPSHLEAQLRSMATEKRSAVDVINFVGIALKARMSQWAQRDTNVTGETFVQRYTLAGKDKTFLQCVDFFRFDAGSLKTIPSYYLLTDADGEDTAYTPRSGAIVEMDMFQIRYLQEERSVENPDLGGGPRGFHDSIFRFECGNPRAMGTQLISSDS